MSEPSSADLRSQGNDTLKAGDVEGAVRMYGLAAEVSRPGGPRPSPGDHTAALLNRAVALMKLGRHAEARRDCDVVLGAEPGNSKALFRAVQASWGMGDVPGATALVPRLHAAAGDDAAVVALIRTIRSGGKEDASASAPASGRSGLRPGSCTLADVARAAVTYARAGGTADASKALLMVVDAAVPSLLSSALPAGVITLTRRAGWTPTPASAHEGGGALAGCTSALPGVVHGIIQHGAATTAPSPTLKARHAVLLWLTKGLAAAAAGGWAAEVEEAHAAGPVALGAVPIPEGTQTLPAVMSHGAAALAGDLARAASAALESVATDKTAIKPSDLLQPSGAAIAGAATTPLQHAFPLALAAMSAALTLLQRCIVDTMAQLLKASRPPALLSTAAPAPAGEGDASDVAAREARKGVCMKPSLQTRRAMSHPAHPPPPFPHARCFAPMFAFPTSCAAARQADAVAAAGWRAGLQVSLPPTCHAALAAICRLAATALAAPPAAVRDGGSGPADVAQDWSAHADLLRSLMQLCAGGGEALALVMARETELLRRVVACTTVLAGTSGGVVVSAAADCRKTARTLLCRIMTLVWNTVPTAYTSVASDKLLALGRHLLHHQIGDLAAALPYAQPDAPASSEHALSPADWTPREEAVRGCVVVECALLVDRETGLNACELPGVLPAFFLATASPFSPWQLVACEVLSHIMSDDRGRSLVTTVADRLHRDVLLSDPAVRLRVDVTGALARLSDSPSAAVRSAAAVAMAKLTAASKVRAGAVNGGRAHCESPCHPQHTPMSRP